MTTGFGADPVKDVNGNVTVGTTEQDIRQITGSLYSAGLISGGVVTRSASAMTYSVSAGVAAFPITVDASTPYKPENQRTVLGPIPAAPSLATTAPSSGTRVDMIYAQQLTPTDDGDANVVVRIGTTLPARSVLLDAYIVSSTNTNTMATVKSVDIKYSIPYGAPRGTPWFSQRSTYNGTFNATHLAAASGSFFLPSDRVVSCNLNTSLNSNGAVGFDNSKYCEAAFAVYIDNIWKFTWTTQGLHQAMADYNWQEMLTIPAGTHTVRVDRWRSAGVGTPFQRYGQGNLGLLFEIRDVGPAA
jgi:hypothetical protein